MNVLRTQLVEHVCRASVTTTQTNALDQESVLTVSLILPDISVSIVTTGRLEMHAFNSVMVWFIYALDEDQLLNNILQIKILTLKLRLVLSPLFFVFLMPPQPVHAMKMVPWISSATGSAVNAAVKQK